jgi:hypothetical protein
MSVTPITEPTNLPERPASLSESSETFGANAEGSPRAAQVASTSSPQTPTQAFSGLVNELAGSPSSQEGVLRLVQRGFGNQYTGEVLASTRSSTQADQAETLPAAGLAGAPRAPSRGWRPPARRLRGERRSLLAGSCIPMCKLPQLSEWHHHAADLLAPWAQFQHPAWHLCQSERHRPGGLPFCGGAGHPLRGASGARGLDFNGAAHPASAFYRGAAVVNSTPGDGTISGPLDTLQITPGTGATELRLVSICYETVQAKDWRTQPRSEQPPERHPTAVPVETLLKLNTRYKLAVVAQQRERRVGDAGFTFNRQEPEPKLYYFRTADAPGLNPTGPDVPPELAVDFRDGPLNRLETYVAGTLPASGARVFYPDYGVLVAFNEAYAASFYGERLRMRFKDRNGKELKTRDGRAAFWERIRGRNMPFVKKGLTDYTDAPSPEGCDSPRTWHKVEQEFVVGRLPDTARLQRMVTAELVADRQVLYLFSFTLSRFRNIREHLEWGLEADRAPVVRTRLPEITPPETWPDLADASDKARRVRDARYSLYVSVAISPTEADFFTVEEAFAAVEEAKQALQNFSQDNYAKLNQAVQPAFEEADMGHRPLPRHVELVQVHPSAAPGTPPATAARMFLLLESPEPFDTARLTLKYNGDHDVRLVWSEDGTRAFLFSAEADGLFAPGNYEFTFYYHYGGPSALDLLPVYVDGILREEEEQVTWNVSLA